MRLRHGLIALFAAALIGVGAGSAVAQPSAAGSAAGQVGGQVLIILASDGEGPRDPRLANVPALRRPPFDSYRSMALLSSPRVQLTIGQAHELELPNGRTLRLVLREVTANGRYRVQVSINRPGTQDYLPEMNVVTSPGDPFFVAGQSHRDGTLILGIRLGERAAG